MKTPRIQLPPIAPIEAHAGADFRLSHWPLAEEDAGALRLAVAGRTGRAFASGMYARASRTAVSSERHLNIMGTIDKVPGECADVWTHILEYALALITPCARVR